MRYDKYDTQGACHWEEYRKSYSYRPLVDDSLIPFIKAERGTLIDVGCGDGKPTCLLAEMGFKVTGVEIEPIGIKLAKEMCKANVEWICSDIADFKVREFDYLYSLNTIEHLEDDKVMFELINSVKNFAIIVTDDGDNCKKGNPFHEKEYTRKSFKRLFKEFELEEIMLRDIRFFGYKIWAK